MQHSTAPADGGALAVVQWTHTLRMRPMLLAARHQILQRRPQAEHHVILASCGGGSHNCTALRDGVWPLVENVTCVTAHNVADELPAYSASYANGRRTYDRDLKVGAPQWCWLQCDGPYVYWYATVGHKLHHVKYFWFLEWDVVWTGNVFDLLDAWSGHMPYTARTDPSVESFAFLNESAKRKLPPAELEARIAERNATPPDLLCPNPSKVNTRWKHRLRRDVQTIPLASVFKCVTEVFRLTHRLLSGMVEFSRSKNHSLFCEMRAASVCAMMEGCRMRSIFDADHLHLLHSSNRGYDIPDYLRSRFNRTGVNVSVVAAREKWVLSYIHDGGVTNEELANMHEPKLYHAYKWNDSVRLDTRSSLYYDAESSGFGAALRRAGQLRGLKKGAAGGAPPALGSS